MKRLSIICQMILLSIIFIGCEDNVEITSDTVKQVQHLQVDNRIGKITADGPSAKETFQLLVDQKSVTKKHTIPQSSTQYKFEFTLNNGKKVNFNVSFVQVDNYHAEGYIQRVGDDVIYKMDANEATNLAMQFMN